MSHDMVDIHGQYVEESPVVMLSVNFGTVKDCQ